MNITLKLKRPKSSKSVIFVEFFRHGIYYKFYTGKTILTQNWSAKKEMVLSGEENHELINLYLQNWLTELKRIFAEMEANQQRLSKEAIQIQLDKYFKKDSIENSPVKAIVDFISFIEAYIKKGQHSKRNIQRLNQTKKHIIIAFELITQKNLKEWDRLSIKEKSITDIKADYKLHFEDVNIALVEKFRNYLYQATYTVLVNGTKVSRNYKINYIDKQIKTLKQFIMAAEDDYVKRFKWNGIKSLSKDVDSIYTDFSEIQAMFDIELEKPSEKLVRDKYILNCFLGKRYSDLNNLEAHFFTKKLIAGKEYIVYNGRTKKTDTLIEFALHPIATEILKKYNYSMPKLSAKEFNVLIKVVAYKAGLRGLVRIREIRGKETITRDVPKYELMSSHAGRRSFCTNFYNEGVSIAAIMSISGHQTEKEFRKYIKKASVRLEIVAEQISAIRGINHLRVA